MNSPDAPPLADCVICPDCLAVFRFPAHRCGHCNMEVGWLTVLPDLVAALLAESLADSARLCIRVAWPGGESEWMAQPPGRLELNTGPSGAIQAEWPGGTTSMSVSLTDSSPPMTVALPGEIDLEGVKIVAWLTVQPPPQLTPQPIRKRSRAPVPLDVGQVVRLGSRVGRPHAVELDDAKVSLDHALIARQPQTLRYWLVDLGSEGGTFVNRQPIRACRLEGGDLVQIGPFAWIFSQEDGFLIPVAGIEGVEIQLHGVEVAGRIAELDLSIAAGQMVAITGPSGAGKSTMVDTILKGRRGYDCGRVLVGGHDTESQREWYRRIVAYVSQKEVVHAELTAKQAVAFSARLREMPADDLRVERILRQVDLPQGTWNRVPKDRSGGESKRVRIAAELITSPRLLILDEPGSGLDRDREASLMRLLRSLSYRGCTVLVVTHNLRHLDEFDRVLVIRGGTLRFDGDPAELRSETPSGDLADLDLGHIEQRSEDRRHGDVPSEEPQQQSRVEVRERLRRSGKQAAVLLQRELALLGNFPGRRLLVPLAVVPAFFALALHLSVQLVDTHLMGFLAILSCIWMGSSLSLMSIVNERDVLEHERLLFLRLPPYVSAKTAVLWLLSPVQTLIFLLLLVLFRSGAGNPPLYGTIWVMLVLILVGYAAVGVGLIISAIAGDNKPMANFLLPLVIMVQIVFSVQVAGEAAGSLADAYGEFHWGHANPDGLRARYWIPDSGGWVGPKYGEDSEKKLDTAAILHENLQRPNLWAARASYFTISRYADILLRSFAYSRDDFEAFGGGKTSLTGKEQAETRQDRFGYSRWRYEALAVLCIFALGGPIVTTILLACQEQIARQFRRGLAKVKHRASSLAITGTSGAAGPVRHG